jgi:GNAT superfamily N-acetyltransferase
MCVAAASKRRAMCVAAAAVQMGSAERANAIALMHTGLDATLVWWLASAFIMCVFFLLVWSVFVSHRRCWRVSSPAKEVHRDACIIDAGPIKLQSLPFSHRRDAAILAARAFCDSPAYVYILRGDRVFRQEALVWLFERNIALVQDAPNASDPTRCLLSDSGRVLCFFWLTPIVSHVSLWSKIRAGLLFFPILFGWKPFVRLLSLGDAFDKTTCSLVQKFVPSELVRQNTLVLERMVVEPTLHGRGLGSACLHSALSQAAAGSAVVLTTQLQRNVEFYTRLGFHVIHEQRVGAAADPFSFRSWCMLRHPPAPAVNSAARD